MSPMLAVTRNAKRNSTSICNLKTDYVEYNGIAT